MNVKISHTALGNISVLLFFSFGCKPDVGHKSDSLGGGDVLVCRTLSCKMLERPIFLTGVHKINI